jgi:hypothetical protein
MPALPSLQSVNLGTTNYALTQYEYDSYLGSGSCPDSILAPNLNAAQHGPVCTQSGIVQMDPTPEQLATAIKRTGEVVRNFEGALYRVGYTLRKTESEIGEQLYMFQNNLNSR